MQLLDFKTGIDFGATGNLKEFSPVGFSPTPDDVSTWSEASVAELTFRLPPLRHDVRFVIEVFPFLVEGLLPQQGCWVFFNGLFVSFHAIKAPVEMTFTITRDLLSARANRLSFALPNATAPKDLRMGDDLRLLGLSFVKLSADDASAPAPQRRDAKPADRGGALPPMSGGSAAALDLARPADRGAAPARPGRQHLAESVEPAARGNARSRDPAK